MAILSKGCKPDNFDLHISLKLNFTNIRGLRSNFVECDFFLESNCPDILALCETNLDDSIDSGNFSVRGYLPLIRKDSIIHMHGLGVYVQEGLLFPLDLSPENSVDFYVISNDLTQMVNFPTTFFPTVTHTVLLFWISFF